MPSRKTVQADDLRIGGLVPFTAIDYPGHLAAVVFCQGCPWRCSYCHNPHLIPVRGRESIPWRAVVGLLERRRGLLDAVVFSGGEPTLQPALPAAMRAVKAMGYKVGLHTAGIYPARLAEVLGLADWVGIDVKAPFDDYPSVTGRPASARRARMSVELVRASGVACQFRTTVDPRLLTPEQLHAVARQLAAMGVTQHVVQTCR